MQYRAGQNLHFEAITHYVAIFPEYFNNKKKINLKKWPILDLSKRFSAKESPCFNEPKLNEDKNESTAYMFVISYYSILRKVIASKINFLFSYFVAENVNNLLSEQNLRMLSLHVSGNMKGQNFFIRSKFNFFLKDLIYTFNKLI